MDSVETALSPVPSTPFSTALVSGGLAGTAVDTLFFPIDTLKTRAQSEQGFFRAGGFSGVYRGLGSAVVGSAPGGTSREFLFDRREAFDTLSDAESVIVLRS